MVKIKGVEYEVVRDAKRQGKVIFETLVRELDAKVFVISYFGNIRKPITMLEIED